MQGAPGGDNVTRYKCDSGRSAENVGPTLGPCLVLSEPFLLRSNRLSRYSPRGVCSGCWRSQVAQGLGTPEGVGQEGDNMEEIEDSKELRHILRMKRDC